ncbi:DUF1788 domain-containing protein [candidate division KSB1 bacterium]|nr:DUF1788 domain-containing protein [candidate division KSB1 bacterium]
MKAVPPTFAMTAELPFAIFRYDPFHADEGEWKMRKEIQHLRVRVENTTGRKVHILPLAELFWRSIEESEGLEALIGLERERGFEAAQAQLSTYLSDPDWRPLPALLVEATAHMDARRDYLFLTRAAIFAPAAYRISALLEQMKGKMMVPTVLFYPGNWNGSLNYMSLRGDEVPLGSYRVKIYGRET